MVVVVVVVVVAVAVAVAVYVVINSVVTLQGMGTDFGDLK